MFFKMLMCQCEQKKINKQQIIEYNQLFFCVQDLFIYQINQFKFFIKILDSQFNFMIFNSNGGDTNKNSYKDWTNERVILEQRIEMLNEQIGQYKKREEYNKTLNNTLIEVVNGINKQQNRSKEIELTIMNQQLKKQITQMDQMHLDTYERYESQIKDLKRQISQLQTSNQKLGIENQKLKVAYQSKINTLQNQLKMQDNKLKNCSDQIRNLENTKQKLEHELENIKDKFLEKEEMLKKSTISNSYNHNNQSHLLKSLNFIESRINYKDQPMNNNMLASRIQGEQDENDMNNLNSMISSTQTQGPSKRDQRVNQYMKKSKNELKQLFTTIKKVKEKLLEQQDQIVGASFIAQRTQRNTYANPNKTFYK